MNNKKVFAVTISQNRYEELLRAESKLEIICRMLVWERPYGVDRYRTIAGEKLIPKDTEDNHESES